MSRVTRITCVPPDGDLERDERPGLRVDAAADGLCVGEHHGVAPVLRRGHVQVQAQAPDQDRRLQKSPGRSHKYRYIHHREN